mmetsp:Transcript_81829/g.219759  ORF Transcript_81829/g.219759 Transcript_81829/m.219759 type:complete len:316 (+) Transcript_81829:199-1146(+)
MSDDSLDATAIDLDHNQMLISDPNKNKAFLKVFGRFLSRSSLQQAPDSATQLTQVSAVHKAHSSVSPHNSLKVMNKDLAAQMQAELTASAGTRSLLNARHSERGPKSKSSKSFNGPSASALDALNMANSKENHLLPAKLRMKFVIHRSEANLAEGFGSASRRADSKKVHQSTRPSSAVNVKSGSKADDKFLAPHMAMMSTAELVKRAAMKQLRKLQQTKLRQANVMQLSQKSGQQMWPQQSFLPNPNGGFASPSVSYAQPAGYPTGAYGAAGPYQPVPSPQLYSPYQSTAPVYPFTYISPAQNQMSPYGYGAPRP